MAAPMHVLPPRPVVLPDRPHYPPVRPPISRISQNTRRAENAARVSAQAVRDADRAMQELRDILAVTKRLARPWARACWICGAPAMCEHREAELVEVWQQ